MTSKKLISRALQKPMSTTNNGIAIPLSVAEEKIIGKVGYTLLELQYWSWSDVGGGIHKSTGRFPSSAVPSDGITILSKRLFFPQSNCSEELKHFEKYHLKVEILWPGPQLFHLRCAPFPVLKLQMAINLDKMFYYAMLQTETLPALLFL